MRPGKVYVKKVRSKKFLQLAWIDPDSGRERRKSANTTREREALKEAQTIEATLFRGVPFDGISWEDFCDRYEAEQISTLKPNSQKDWRTTKYKVAGVISPLALRDVTPSAVSKFAAELRKTKKPGTVARYLATLRAALRWAELMRLIHEAPYISIPRKDRRSRAMKGRPITLEEFERMLKVVDKVVEKPEYAESWKHTLWVYWLSGIRLAEAVELYWDRPDKLCIHGIDRRRPMLLIHQELEKGNQDRHYPLTPDFVAYLRKTPASERHGRVCRPLTTRGVTDSVVTIGRTISEIGSLARVSVGPSKFASAHDLRRSFGTRWAPLVQAPLLQQLMRHKSLATTMKYYVELRAAETADTLWAAYKTTSGDLLGDLSAKSDQPSKTVVS